MIHSDELSHESTLRYFEGLYEAALNEWNRHGDPHMWERQNDLARLVRGHCKAYGLIPAVDVGRLD